MSADLGGLGSNPAPKFGGAFDRRHWARWFGQGIIVVLILAALYYPAGMIWTHKINDNPDFAPVEAPAPGASNAVAIAIALIERETVTTTWVANNPFFMPSSLLDNMPNFQQGVIGALSRFGIELADQLGRTRGSSQIDPDLDKAAGLLKYPGTVWLFDPSTSWTPTASSEKQYKSAMRSLIAYNQRLAAGEAVFDRRSDNLMATLERFSQDIGSLSAAIDTHLRDNTGLFDLKADDVYYANKGRLYAYYLLLRELHKDFAPVIAERKLDAAWTQMLESFRIAATLDPLVIINGAPDSNILPSHLAAQGFYLLRARTQLKEVSNILLK